MDRDLALRRRLRLRRVVVLARRGPVTVVLVMRHAEKAAVLPPEDPPLTAAGTARAQDLARVLGACGIQHVYVTEFQRTQLTAQPLVTLTAAVRDQVVHDQVADLVARIRSDDRGRTVLVVAHSNTAPQIVNELLGETLPLLPESQFDNLIEVILPRCGPARVLPMKYRVSTP